MAKLTPFRRWSLTHPRLYFTGPAVAWAAFVFWASLAPPSELPHFDFNLADKVEHLLSYAVLGALMLRAWVGAWRPVGFRAVLGTVGLAYAWGMLLEVFQGMTDYRTFDLVDGLSDLVGALIGALAWFYAVRALRNRADRVASPLPPLQPSIWAASSGQGNQSREGHEKK